MKAAHRVIKNTGILYARMAITVFLSLYTTRITLKALGVEDFGVFNLVGGVIAMLGFLNASMATATQRFMSYAHGQGDEGRQLVIFNASLILHVAVAFGLLFLLQAAGHILFNGVFNISPSRVHAASVVYQVAVVSALFMIVGVPYDAVINARENMLLFAILGVIESFLKLCIALFVLDFSGDKLIAYAALMAVLAVCMFVGRMSYCHARYAECRLVLRKGWDRPLLKEMTSFAGWSFFSTSVSMVSNYGQGSVLNSFFGSAVNAAQGVSSQINGQLGAFSATMLKALNPIIVKSEGAGDKEGRNSFVFMGSKIGFFLLAILNVPVIFFAPFVLTLWLGNVPEYTVVFCRLLLCRQLIEQATYPFVHAIFATGELRSYCAAHSLLTLVPLPLSVGFMVLGYGPSSIYWVFIAYSIVAGGVVSFYADRVCGISMVDQLRSVGVGCAILIVAITLFLSGLTSFFSINLTSAVVGFIGSFFVASFVMWRFVFSASERAFALDASSTFVLKLKRRFRKGC